MASNETLPSKVTFENFKPKDINGISYFRCAPSNPKHEIVLLHGAKYHKEDWKTVMVKICDHYAVTAMDLSVRSQYEPLEAFLEQLTTLPVTLVTPSASGSTMVDWISRGAPNVASWIAVACPSVLKMKQWPSITFPVLAIHGESDTRMGSPTSAILKEHYQAKVVELEGSHAVYLDSPDTFVKAVMDHLEDL